MGGEYEREVGGQRINSAAGTCSVPPVPHRAGKLRFHVCPDMVKVVG